MSTMFLDLETCGLPLKGKSASHPGQPKIAELAYLVVDNDGTEVASFDTLIRCGEIPAEATAVHGISTERANTQGIGLGEALRIFMAHFVNVDLVVCHNTDFDLFVLECAFHRDGWAEAVPTFKAKRSFCTMKASVDILRLPPTQKMLEYNIRKFKSPKLSEAYTHFTGQELVGAHSAIVDVRAARVVYDHLQAISAT